MSSKPNLLFCLIITVVVTACGPKPLARDNSTISALKQAVLDGKYMYGHQDDLMYGHYWNANEDNDFVLERSDVLSTAGAYPMVLGLDLGGIELDADSVYGANTNLDGNNFDIMLEAARKHHARGGIVTMSWHLRNPLTGGDAWDVSDKTVVKSILPGGECHDKFMSWLGKLGDYLEKIKDIPVIFRPWHEHTGSWFWWGAELCSAEEYNALWVMTYDYLMEDRGLDNLVWAISPNGTQQDFEKWMERYPGDDYVDIIGLDQYESSYPGMEDIDATNTAYIAQMRELLGCMSKIAEEHNKILAVTETGFESLQDENWWTEVLMPALDGFPVSYVLTWRNTSEEGRRDVHYYAPFPGSRSEADFKAFAENEKTIFLK